MGKKASFTAFKTKVVLDALKEKETLSELAKKYGIAPKQITDWKKEFLEKSGSVFGEEVRSLESQRPAGLSRNRYCSLMKINRSTLYYKKK